jgi:DNA-binding PadR family transcriptional regulator
MMRHLILGLLRHGRAQHGYALMKEYRDGTGRALSVGNFYRELQRLRDGGMVRPGENPADADPRRIPYQITDAGCAAFDAWLAVPARDGCDGSDEHEHSLRAFLVVKSGGRRASRVLSEWREELKARRRDLGRAHDMVRDGRAADGSVTRPLWLGRRVRHLDVELAFVDELESALQADGGSGPARRPALRSTPRKGEAGRRQTG